ncbi:lipase family protein [Ornithinimicrobium cryptoxanthini]|uniref:Lipase family protein n=1 Tax=Ornithinimicrobium cryptoxanthini TaxID=2934161 RepID=A0ABY4YGV7_9MICO|nr:lipase family protein [Ornithinimicrobium cryptoxanthini]USQ75872.1 lipase family protein [Ornithinimicrobium cryptoxanthini]
MTSPTPGQPSWAIRLQSPPRWLLVVVGLLAVVVGVALVTRPLTSLQALGLYLGVALLALGGLTLIRTDGESDPPGEPDAWETLRAVGAIVLGLLILLWLRHHFDLLALAVGAALVISGVRRLWSATRGQRTEAAERRGTVERVASGVLALAELVIGLLALRWPDLTLLAVAVIFAVRLVVLGVLLIRRGLAGPRQTRAPAGTAPTSSARPWLRLTGSVLTLLLAAGAAFLGYEARTLSPVVDDFSATPADVPDTPGTLLRHEPFTRDVPTGATGWRILYTTTAAGGSPATASGIVLTPDNADAPRPVIAWAHGTTGGATHCAPTLLTHPFEAGAMPALDRVVEQGWALVATDYTGLGTPGAHPYLIGTGEAHSVLDGIRAAQQLPDADLAPQTVVWGHSQGGHAALWTSQLAADYAPELDLRGTVAMAPAADVTALAASLPTVSGGELFASYVITAYAAHYPEITLDQQVIPPARTLVREMSGRCLSEPSILASLLSVLSLARDQSVYATPPTEGALGQRLHENIPTGPFPMPVLIAQGEADTLIQPAHQQAYVDRLCSAGQSPEYRTYPGRDHLSVVEPDSDLIEDLLAWTVDRFDGVAATPNCS